MAKTSIAVRNVDKNVFREFRALAVERGVKLGEALTDALRSSLKTHKIKRRQERKLHSLDEVEPFAFSECPED